MGKSKLARYPHTKPWFPKFMGFTMKHFAAKPRINAMTPSLTEEALSGTFLPINENIELPPNTPLPFQLVADFISQASNVAVADICNCRVSSGCEHYPHDIGCMILGRSALELEPWFGKPLARLITKEEALEYAQRAVNSGLIPLPGRSILEAQYFGIDKDKFLIVCFCCDCCCQARHMKWLPASLRNKNFRKIVGLTIEVGENCKACGECMEVCAWNAISVGSQRSLTDHEICLGCGRCVSRCPNHARRVIIDNPAYLEEIETRLKKLASLS